MKKILSILVGGAVILVVLLVIAIILTMLFFPAEKVRSLVEEQGSAALGMPVTVEDIGISFLGIPALKASGLAVGPPPGLDKPLAELKSLRVRVNLLKLFSRHVEIVSVELDTPRIHVVIPPADSTVTDDEKPAQSEGKPMLPVPVSLRSLRINDGYADIINVAAQTRITLEDISQKMSLDVSRDLSNIRSGGTMTIGDISLVLAPDADPIRGIDLTVVHSVEGNLTTGDFTLKKGVITLNGLPVNITGSLTSWTVATAAVKTGDMDIRTFLDAIPGSLVPEKQNVTADGSFSLTVDSSVSLAGDTPEIGFKGSLDLDMTGLSHKDFPAKIDRLGFHTAFTEKDITIERSALVTGGSELSLTGTISDYLESPALAVNLAGEINVDDITRSLPLLGDGMSLKGIVAMDLAVAGDADDPAGIRPDGTIDLRDFVFELPKVLKHPASLNGSVAITPEALAVTGFALKAGLSDLTFKGALDNYKALAFPEVEGYTEFNGDIASTLLDITDLMVIEEEAEEKPPFKPWQIEDSVSNLPIPPNVAASATVRLGTVRFGTLQAEAVNAALSLRDGILSLSGLKVDAYSGVLTGTTTVNITDPEQVTYKGGFKLDSFESGDFISDFLNTDDFMSGALSTSLTFAGAGLDSVSMLDNLTADGNMLFEDGEINNWDFAKKLGTFLKFLNFDVLTFDNITNTFIVRDRKVTTPDMSVKSDKGTILLDGSAGFDTSLDYVMTLILNKESSAKAMDQISVLSKLVNRETDSLELGVGVGGTFSSPKFSLDTSKAEQKLRDEAKQKVEDKAKELIDKNIKSDELKEEGKKLLKKLFQ